MKKMTAAKAIQDFFGSEGYPPVTTGELLAFRKEDKAGYDEVVSLLPTEGYEITKPSNG